MGWSWTWWIFSARMWAIARRPTTKTRWSTTARGGSLWAEVDLPRNLTLTASLHLKWMVGIRSLRSFPFGATCLFSGDMSVFRELYLHLVWTKNHWFIVHRPFGPSLKRGWDIFVANVTHEKSVTQPLRPGVFHPDGAWTTKTHHFFRCLFVEILTKKRCEIWWVLFWYHVLGSAFWRFQFGKW